MFRILLVILLSLGVFTLSGTVMYATWTALAGLEAFWRGILSLISWIIGFALGSIGFWSAVKHLSSGGVRSS